MKNMLFGPVFLDFSQPVIKGHVKSITLLGSLGLILKKKQDLFIIFHMAHIIATKLEIAQIIKTSRQPRNAKRYTYDTRKK